MTKISKKGSMALIMHPMTSDDGGKYEGSWKDHEQDYSAARRKGISTEEYEGSAQDRIADKAGEKQMRESHSSKIHNTPDYKPGVSSFANKPKNCHGFGHSAQCHDGHLRNSGHSQAHRIGNKGH